MPQLTLPNEVQDAQDVKGSAFDTWKDWYLRQAKGDPMGGMNVTPLNMGVGILRSLGTPEETAAWNRLKSFFPKIAQAIERDPRAEYRVRYNPELTAREAGKTTVIRDAQGNIAAPIDIQFNRNAALPATFAHEPLHGFYAAGGKQGVAPRGQQLLEGLSGVPGDVGAYLKANPEGGPGHGAVARLADRMAYRQGLAPTSYSSVPFPNAGGMKVEPPIGY
jgi:hypothetical protein